ncbi:MAG: hypothetical protein U0V72_00865 [Cytophagales bacterium]
MKKILLSLAIAIASSVMAQLKTYDGYTLNLKYNFLTASFDTNSLGRIKFNYSGSLENPTKVNYSYENYNYYNGAFEQSMKVESFGRYSASTLGDDFYSDSSKIYFPAKDGSLGWQLYQKSTSIFDNNDKPLSSKMIVDFSYFEDYDIYVMYGYHFPKGFMDYKIESIENTSKYQRSYIQRASLSSLYALTPMYSYDTATVYFDKNGKDSLYVVNYGADENSLYPSNTYKITRT